MCHVAPSLWSRLPGTCHKAKAHCFFSAADENTFAFNPIISAHPTHLPPLIPVPTSPSLTLTLFFLSISFVRRNMVVYMVLVSQLVL